MLETHPMGESNEFKKSVLVLASEDVMAVQTLGGRVHTRWDDTAQATPHGQLVFFAEFLSTAGVFDEWVQGCPLQYHSPNASSARDILGTLMLGILAGSKRYAHIGAVRGDHVAAQALGLSRIKSSDSVRRALKAIPAESAQPWMRGALMHSVRDALQRPWILDIDTTIKPLYGHQEGAQISYNPHKPGRPSHVLHTFWVGNLRLVLDVQMSPGKEHAPKHAKDTLCELLEDLNEASRPRLVRGDCAYGNEELMLACEQHQQGYLFRLRQTPNVKRLLARVFNKEGWSKASELSQGWQAIEDELRLVGWSKKRRVIVLRRRIKQDVAATHQISPQEPVQMVLALTHDELQDQDQLWEYTVLVNNTDHEVQALGQLYRDRCDCENGFDELKNQWGWGGFTTQDMHRSRITAQSVALVYNWWSWYARAANPQARREASTSRPLLLAAVGRAVKHAGQTTLHLTPMHAEVGLIKTMVSNVRAAVAHVVSAAQQLPKLNRWKELIRYICDRIVDSISVPAPLLRLERPG